MLGQTNILTDGGTKQAKDLKLTDHVLASEGTSYLPKVIKTVDSISDIYRWHQLRKLGILMPR